MARGATIYKVELDVADMDRQYYARHSLTLACHPSETEERMMVRLFAFILFAAPELTFCRGVSTQDEPDLWEKDLTGALVRWVDLGHPESRAVRRACGRSREVAIICFGGRGSDTWWSESRGELERLRNLSVIQISVEDAARLASMAERTLQLQANIQDGSVTIIGDDDMVEIEPVYLLRPAVS